MLRKRGCWPLPVMTCVSRFRPCGCLRPLCNARRKLNHSALRLTANHINTSSKILEDLVNPLFDVARIDTGVIALVVTYVKMQSLFDRLREEFRSPAVSLGLRLSIMPSRLTVRSGGFIL